jgi:hypothetical protein
VLLQPPTSPPACSQHIHAALIIGLAQTSSLLLQSQHHVCERISRFIDARGELAVLALLRPDGASGTLDLSTCAFEALPSIMWELPGRAAALKELNLTNNRLRTLPAVSVCPDNSWCISAMRCAAVRCTMRRLSSACASNSNVGGANCHKA